MNTGIQNFGFVQVQGPVSNSKNIGSATASSGSESKSFDNLLAGLLGSNQKNSNSEIKGEKGNPGIYGSLMDLMINLQQPEIDMPEELVNFSEVDEEKITMDPKMMTDELKNKFDVFLSKLKDAKTPEEFSLIKEKIFKLMETSKVFASEFSKEIFSEENLKNMTLDEKKEFLSKLGKELIGILVEKEELSSAEKFANLENLKETVTKKENPLAALSKFIEDKDKLKETAINSVLKNVTEEKGTSKSEGIKESKVDINNQSSQNKVANLQTDGAQDKNPVSFQKSLDENIQKLSDQQLTPEKVEPKNLPKFIENQIKNSFKSGEAGYREITVKINPEHLGKLILKIASQENSEMTVKIIAESKNIKEFLDANLSTLRNNLETSGIKTNGFTIEVDFEKNFNQFNGSNQNSSGNSRKNKEESTYSDNQSFEEQIESIFNNRGGLEVFA